MKKIKWTEAPRKAIKSTYKPKAKMITKGVSKASKKGC